jgi:DNA-binding MarR family transcriptional regulator
MEYPAMAAQMNARAFQTQEVTVHESYLETIRLTERLHRQFLEVVKNELEQLGIEDLNNVQSLILFNIGKNEYTVGELTGRGYYLGSNVSYNVRKMVEHGYLVQERSTHDRRSVRVRLTPKGIAVWEQLDAMFDRQVSALAALENADELESANGAYKRLERFWIGLSEFGPEAGGRLQG